MPSGDLRSSHPSHLLLAQVGSTVLKGDGSCSSDDDEVFIRVESIINNLPKVFRLIIFKCINILI